MPNRCCYLTNRHWNPRTVHPRRRPDNVLIDPRTSSDRSKRPRQPETLPNVEGLGPTRSCSANRHPPRTTSPTRTRPHTPDNDLPNTAFPARQRPPASEHDLANPKTTTWRAGSRQTEPLTRPPQHQPRPTCRTHKHEQLRGMAVDRALPPMPEQLRVRGAGTRTCDDAVEVPRWCRATARGPRASTSWNGIRVWVARCPQGRGSAAGLATTPGECGRRPGPPGARPRPRSPMRPRRCGAPAAPRRRSRPGAGR